jgi:hypothetical protein
MYPLIIVGTNINTVFDNGNAFLVHSISSPLMGLVAALPATTIPIIIQIFGGVNIGTARIAIIINLRVVVRVVSNAVPLAGHGFGASAAGHKKRSCIPERQQLQMYSITRGIIKVCPL